MKIVFVGLASSFTPRMNYQDNALCHQMLADGHQVIYISNPEKFVDGVMVDTDPEDIVLEDGLHLIRVPYCKIGPTFCAKKFRKFKGVYKILVRERPNVIFCHNTQYWSVLDVIRYKKEHPEVKFYADTHTAAYNSGTNWISLNILHRGLYRYLTQKTLPYLEKYFYIGESERKFSIENYAVPESVMEFYPLGGTIPAEEEYIAKRSCRRKELNLGADEVLLLHSGKMGPLKRTVELLRAFAAVPEWKARMVIVGSFSEDMKVEIERLVEADDRVQYLGWKTGDELREYLYACDLYCQPGSVSATMQNAICSRCPLLLYPHEPYTKDYDYGNIIWTKTEEDMINAFCALKDGKIDLATLRDGSDRCAHELLDYRALAARLYR